MMEIKTSDWIRDFLSAFVQIQRDAFGENLIGVYLHGSLVMESFNPISSDVDLLVVVRDRLSRDQKSALGQRLLQLSEQAPPNGLEMSILTASSLRDFQYPTPYELHFSNGNKDQFAQGTMDFADDQTDPDLAAHFVITKARGLCLYGAPIDSIFPDVPAPYYLDSLAQDAEWSTQNIQRGADYGECPVPVYAVLNFCRVLAYIEQGVITSKREGGQWGLKNLAPEYKPVIQEALREYATSGTARPVDCHVLKEFAYYANAIIQQARS
ncbi:MAG: aminoglycoside adenylyltransferase domain-containing protein [Chloroflexota bacterium]